MLRFLRKCIVKLRSYCLWLLRQEGTPGERARGLAVGVFSGCFPLFGFQIVLGILLSTILKGNRLLAVSGTWISNPMTYLPLFWFNYNVGCFFLGNIPGDNNYGDIDASLLWNKGYLFLIRIFFGSIIIGILSSLLIGILFYFILIYKDINRSSYR